MRYVKYILAAIILLILVTVGLANRQVVSLTILPEGLEQFIGLNALVGPIQIQLYLVVFASLAIGLAFGFFWEWVREFKLRKEASKGRQSNASLEAEVKKMKARENAGKDEVLVLLEDTDPSRRKVS